ncbi:MAG: LeuD/DmdB family oxidoreductase small subunit [Burkholderiales bacterium]
MNDTNKLLFTGRVWKFGDLINTDMIMPSAVFRLPKAEQHTLCFESIRPGWSKQVQKGDILVAGENFGMGSGRPIGEVLRACGIVGVLGESINGLAMRNCINSSLPGLSCAGVSRLFEDGDTARVDFLSGKIENVTRGTSLQTQPLAPLLVDIVEAGGVIPMLIKEGYVHAEPFAAAAS